MEKFSDWLMQELSSRNMSQSDLSRASNVTTAQISRIISGQRNPGQDTLTAIAKAFKLPPEFVFEKAGLLPPRTDLSPLDRTIMELVKNLPVGDKKAFQAMLEAWEDNKSSTTAAPKTAK